MLKEKLKELPSKTEYILCVRCNEDFTNDFKYGLCSCCQVTLDEDFELYKNGEKDDLYYDEDFYKEFTCIEEIFETYRDELKSGEFEYVDSDIDKELFTIDDLGEYELLINYMLDEDLINATEWDNFLTNTYDLSHWKLILEETLEYIEEELDDISNNRDLTDDKKYKKETDLFKIRYLAQLRLDNINYDIRQNELDKKERELRNNE